MRAMTLRHKLVTGLAVLTAAICLTNGLTAAILYSGLRERHDSRAVCEAARTAAVCIGADGSGIDKYLRDVTQSTTISTLYILVLEDRTLRCIRTPGRTKTERIDLLSQYALETALAALGGEGRAVIRYEAGRRDRTAAYVPFVDGSGRTVGLVTAETSMTAVKQDTRRFCLWFLLGSIPVLGLACVLYYRLLSREIIHPFDRLRRMTAAGEDGVACASPALKKNGHKNDEIDQLTAAVEQMAAECHACRSQLNRISSEREQSEAEKRALHVQQEAIFAEAFPSALITSEAELRAVRLPGTKGGDGFIDFFVMDETRIGITMARLPGPEQLSAARLLAVKIRMKDGLLSGKMPGEILGELLRQSLRRKGEISLWIGILEQSAGLLTYAGVHDCSLYLKQADKPFTVQAASDSRENSLTLQPSDTLFLGSGVQEAADLCQEAYGEERLISELNFLKDRTPEEILDGVRKDLRFFSMGAEQDFDIPMMALKYRT